MDTSSRIEPFDFESSPPHPLTYASLVPWHSCKYLRRLDLHKPKFMYTLGRAPTNDFTFESRDISWQCGSLVWDGEHKICLNLHESSISSIWINCKQLLPGQSRVLKQGDQIRVGTVTYKRHNDTFSVRDMVYVFHQFTSDYPPNLSPEYLEIRKRLDGLERERFKLTEALPSIPAV
ncbi:hypothetical protein PENSPDRAFT_295910 [Peniophora sp. CONT]|nr:hypothetical protein PENSPDRAFT_295910 [Peniophora sp. CONT]